MASQNRIKQLEKKIAQNKELYYKGQAQISDEEYDKLEDELRELDPQNILLQTVGSRELYGQKIKHDKKMLSLDKTYLLDDLIFWKKNNEIISTYKIDGSSCSIIFEKGQYKQAKTRGDGSFGENITDKIVQLPSVPLEISFKNKIEVRGEVFCTEENFIHLSQKMEELKLERPTSQRNIVAGLLGRKENHELCSYLDFQAFDLIADDIKMKTEVEKMQTLKTWGFSIPEFVLHKNENDIKERLEEVKEFMAHGNYLIDGLVFTLNEIKLHDELGETAHHPRYKMAFKFQGEAKTTVLKSITWQISRNGTATPVAEVEEVELSGAKINRVTLHNYGMVNQYQLKAGDKIEIVRSGEVIPKFLRVIESSNNKFKIPLECPSCSQKLFIEDIRLKCRNELCPQRVIDEFLNFIKKMNIEDLSVKRLEVLIKKKLVTDLASLYSLTREQLLSLDKVKDKLADKIISNIQASKNVDLVTFLSALGLSGGAYNKCEKIVNHGYDSISKVLSLTKEKLIEIDSFADKSATEFMDSLNEKKDLIQKLINSGVKIKPPTQKSSTRLSGKKFCITGTLSMKRSDIEALIKDHAGLIVGSVSKNTDYLVTNDKESSSSKFQKAKSLGIPIISEKMLVDLTEA